MHQGIKHLRAFGGCRLDVEKKILWHGEQPVALPSKAIELLCVLVERGGEVVGKEEIWREVWQDSFVEETNLTHNIYLLRKTLKELGETNLIQTVPRRGYRFSGEIHKTVPEAPAAAAAAAARARRDAPEAAPEIREGKKGIAVLPFVNLSVDAENDFFCEGLAEELLNALAKIEKLKVAARTSSFSFRNKDVGIGEIGRALNVDAVLDGSVRRAGNRLRIMAQLVDTNDGFHLWSESYDREINDIFDVQDEITMAIVDGLKVKLLAEEKSAVLRRYTENTEVYELYLKGRYHSNSGTGSGLRKGNELFRRAIEKEPEYAPAYAGIALNLSTLWYFGVSAASEIVPEWRAMANRALEIDSRLPEAHYTLATILFYYDWNWTQAEREYARAVDINASGAEAFWRYGMFLACSGKRIEAVEAVERGLALDPLSLLVNLYAGITYWFADRPDGAARQARRLIEIDPRFFGGYWLMGVVHKARGEYREAVEELQKSVQLTKNQTVLSILGDTYGLMGDRRKALEILDQLLAMRERQYVAAFNIARVYNGLGENERAFEWLEKAVAERNGELVFLDAETRIGAGFIWNEAFRRDERFDRLREKCCPPFSSRETAEETIAAKNTDEISPTAPPPPAGEKSLAPPPPPPPPRISRRAFAVAAAALFLILLFAGRYGLRHYKSEPQSAVSAEIKSIAVLPMKSFDKTPDNETLCLRMTDSLITKLGNLDAISVRPIVSVQNFLEEGTDALEVGKRLGVDAVVDGRMQREGEKVRVTLRLISVRDGKQIWSEQFDGQADQLLNLQDVISTKLLTKINLPLTPEQTAAFAKRPTENAEAFENYLKGRYFWQKRSPESLQAAIGFYEKAIAADPNFAEAYVGLADSYYLLVDYSYDTSAENVTRSKENLLKAIGLKPNLAEAYVTLGLIETTYEWEWRRAEQSFLKALELSPNLPDGHHRYSILLLKLRRFAESEAEIRRAKQLDPLSLSINKNFGTILFSLKRFDEAIDQFNKTIELDPNFTSPRWYLARCYWAKGKKKESLAEYVRALQSSGDAELAEQIERQMAVLEPEKVIENWAQKWSRQIRPTGINEHDLAVLSAFQNKSDETLSWLEKSVESRHPWATWINAEPEFDFLRDHPRFREMLRKMNLGG